MIYKAVEVIWIFSADGTGGTDIEGSIRGPRGPKKKFFFFLTQNLADLLKLAKVMGVLI